MKVINRIYIYDNRVKNITSFTLQLAHFRNMLIILLHKLKNTMGYYPTSEGLLYSLLVDKLNLKRTKDENKIEKLNKLLEFINSDNSLSELLNSLKKLKRELSNNYAIQSVIRHVCKNFKSYRKAYEEYLKNPNKFILLIIYSKSFFLRATCDVFWLMPHRGRAILVVPLSWGFLPL